MKEEIIQSFILKNNGRFDPLQLQTVRQTLADIDDSKGMALLGINFWDPTVMLIIAIFLGWERFFLDDIPLGILKVLTCYGCGIWWLVDLFSVRKRTEEYNFRKFSEIASLCK